MNRPTTEPFLYAGDPARFASVETAVARLVRQERRRPTGYRLAQFAAILAAIAAWQVAVTFWLDPFFYSTPAAVARRLVEWFTIGTPIGSIWVQILATLQEALLGFIVGGIAGVVLGVIVGMSRVLSDFLGPFIRTADTVPRIVLAALFFVWFGLGMPSKVATVVVMVFFAVFFDTFRGVQAIDVAMIEDAELFGAGIVMRITTVILPLAAAPIIAGLRSAVGLAWIGAIVAEFIGARKGLGLLIHHGQSTFDTAGIIAGMIVVTAIAISGEALLAGLSKGLRQAPAARSRALRMRRRRATD
jgi:NitT/TauT family transport system permease protein